jgi:hypothetical protein
MDLIEKTRNAAILRLARDLEVDVAKAERWCGAWERFAKRRGVAWNPYFWDSARGWIDAQRSMRNHVGSVVRPSTEAAPAEAEPASWHVRRAGLPHRAERLQGE